MLLSTAGLAQDTPAAPSGPDSDSAASPTTAATAARIDALQLLVSGAHPGVPLDSVLSVSLDDDSSLVERDRELRLARRHATIALRSAERFNNKTEEERQELRDQIFAMELERKVMALPPEVRARLIELDAADDAPPTEPAQAAPQGKAEPRGDREASAAPSSSQRAEAAAPKAQAQAPQQAAAEEAVDGDERERSSPLLPILGLLFGTWLVARLSALGLGWLSTRFPERKARFEQLSTLISFFIWLTGGALTLVFGFSFSLEVLALMFGTLGLTVALAMRELASSLLAGVLLILRRPFELGDQVELDQTQGKVTDIGLTSVRLLTPQQRVVHIPNRVFLSQVVSTQPAATAMTPLQVDFLLDPNQDIRAAKRLLKEAVDDLRSVEMPKSGGILVNQVTVDRMVVLRLRCKLFVMGVQPTAEIRSELTERVLESFRKSGLRMPAAQLPAA